MTAGTNTATRPTPAGRGALDAAAQTKPAGGPARPGLPRLLRDGLALTWHADGPGFRRGAGLQLAAALSPSAVVLVGQYLLRTLTAGGPLASVRIIIAVVLLALATALSTAAAVLQQQQVRLLGERVSAWVWDRILDVTGRVPLERYETAEFYDQLQRVKTNALTQPVAVTNAIFGFAGGAVGTAGLVAVLASIEPLLVPLLLLAGVPSVLLSRRVSRIEYRFLVGATPLYRRRDYLRQTLTGRDEAKEIRVFGSERALRGRHEQRRSEYDARLAAHVRSRQRYAALDVAATSAVLGGTLGVVVWLLASGWIPLASAAAAILAVRFLSTGLDQLFRSAGGLVEASVYLADLDAFLRTQPPAAAVTESAPSLRSRIELIGVSFTYAGSTRQVLHDVDLSIDAGEIVALVGENGSGKTTLAKIVAALYDPTCGRVQWDGRDYRDLGPERIRRQVAIIFQDFVRYQLSAQDNIGLGAPDSAEDVAAALAAARRAGAHEFLAALPDGYSTVLSKEFAGGTDLSGGQWQRVALARALRKNASIVVLDEPTAALDPRAEAQLFADIRANLDGRAALLISHRFSSVRLADRIFVLHDGRIAERGTHEELLDEGGQYAELFRLQAQAYR